MIDADGLNLLAPFKLKGSTGFALDFDAARGRISKADRREKQGSHQRPRRSRARFCAKTYNVILVLKGERNLIAAPDGRVVINPTGNSGLGKAGNGDTLAGIIAGFVAQAAQMKVDIFETVVAAVYIAGLAGDIAAEKFGKRAMLASDVRECLTEAFRQLEED